MLHEACLQHLQAYFLSSYEGSSIGVAVGQLESNGHKVFFHDLYKEDFDPLLISEEMPQDALVPEAVARHSWEIAEAEGIVIVHPNW